MKNGFTLIETTIALAIVAIIASVAIPQYQTYQLRSHVTVEATLARHDIEKAITEYSATYGELPAQGFSDLQKVRFIQDSGQPHSPNTISTKNIQSIDWTGQIIIITFIDNHPQTALSNKTLEITASSTSIGIYFTPSGGSLPHHLHP